ncbi:MAG: ketoacyl-ACP synthase III [Anaerolineae bacterium]|uniref:beta-ketoacyl-ACP synthase III n=1 Tax=Candidatus Flexifilum breve TaxID=3140694 RepID=UPI001AC5FD00|nr:ketoacyl-ACP synthase III [Chloroflexota bacterium]MBK9750446.1 ketoacyl-ACP synthase III [Chloroflexota bacterium]MBN8633958.1 ketoacyl-ACP synthase III [Anaerolineae bacterium]
MHKRGSAPPPQAACYAHIVGWGMAVPETVMTNDDLSAIVETTDDWIRQRTGIRERRIASDKETTATLGLKAAQRALEVADILPLELDMIIVATSTPENVFPSTASLIQSWLGANKAGAFDLSAACSGFVYAVDMAAQAIRSGRSQKALIIGAETMSRVLDWSDRGTCILFGDGAGAVVLEASSVEGGVLSAVLRSDGSGGDLLGIPTFGSTDMAEIETLPNGHKLGKMHMNGGEVFKFASRVIGESINQALDIAGLTIKDLALIVPHQANLRIIAAAARSLKVEESLFYVNLDRYGNTSAASIPIALVEAIQAGRVKENDHIAFVGFGGGLTWASMVVKWGAPKPDDRSKMLNRQRREAIYAFAFWRQRLIRLSRQLNDLVNRIRPNRGRLQRLRRRIDSETLE